MGVIFSFALMLLLYIKRFKADFDDEQVSIFSAFCLVIAILTIVYTLITAGK